ncbi:hypothetical protein NKR23_g9151 [Pleurostoma richardsiae]|uniref:Deacetylase sirtuin-type domain-containing protein n=1 Tax=Pleurostoma richardsiae TaxID=41990 RepID=A0AA38RDD7_9PEZI|nr:hypothetical protein NKR23_g9151 [Pleurostoma richardsiae]
MPTTHVKPESSDILQGIADSLWKSRKVVVVTGAGISTNSGIPDFRSENGLYSMIQAQLDAAVSGSGPVAGDCAGGEDGDYPQGAEQRPAKRRRICCDDEVSLGVDLYSKGLDTTQDEQPLSVREAPRVESQGEGALVREDVPELGGSFPEPNDLEREKEPSRQGSCDGPDDVVVDIELPSLRPTVSPRPTASLRSQAGLLKGMLRLTPGAVKAEPFRLSSDERVSTPRSPGHFAHASSQSLSDSEQAPTSFSSSPLSSPPPVLFDPYEEDTYMRDSTPPSSQRSSSSSADTPPSSNPFFASQSSGSGRSSLPNLKGRDLFDATIWSDPLKTSVFYSFATSLRQRAKNVAPTGCHYFIRQLRDTGKLVRCYTQNIDQMEDKEEPIPPGYYRKEVTIEVTYSRAETPTRAAGSNAFSYTDPFNAFDASSAGEPQTGTEMDERKRHSMVDNLFARTVKEPLQHVKRREHPKAHLISPIVQHDLSLAPDLLLIMGTSLRVHGLKVMVKEFAKAVHNKGGKVVFINFTKPADSVWADVIDYWVEWDCDAWVQDLREKKPTLFLPPGTIIEGETTQGARKRRDARGNTKAPSKTTKDNGDGKTTKDNARKANRRRSDDNGNSQVINGGRKNRKSNELETKGARREKPAAKRPMALRDDYTNGAYLSRKIMISLARISGREVETFPFRTALPMATEDLSPPTEAKKTAEPATAVLDQLASEVTGTEDVTAGQESPATFRQAAIASRGGHKRVTGARKPPELVELPQSTHLRVRRLPVASNDGISLDSSPAVIASPLPGSHEGSVVAAVKSNPRKRKRKTFFDDDFQIPARAEQVTPIKSSTKEAAAKPSGKKTRQKKASQPATGTHFHAVAAFEGQTAQPKLGQAMHEEPVDLILPPLKLASTEGSVALQASPEVHDEHLPTLEPSVVSPGPLIMSPDTKAHAALPQRPRDPFFIQDVLFNQMEVFDDPFPSLTKHLAVADDRFLTE